MEGLLNTSYYEEILFKSIFQIIRLLNIKKIMHKLPVFMVLFCEYYDLTKQHIWGCKVGKMFYSRTYLI